MSVRDFASCHIHGINKQIEKNVSNKTTCIAYQTHNLFHVGERIFIKQRGSA